MMSAVIIGGGFGGLCTGALLARLGMQVTVLEKNPTIGGGLQSFTRKGIDFETGMHILAGLDKGQAVYRIFNYLGIMDRLHIKRSDEDCMDQITYLSNGMTYRIPQSRDNFCRALCAYFPHEQHGIEAYIEACYQLTNEVDMFYLRPSESPFVIHSERFMQPTDEFIASFVTDSRLRDILAYMNPMYGGVAGHTPAYIHAIINVLYIGGQYHFIGRSQHLAEELARVIVEHGGQVLTNKTVSAIETENREVTCVKTTDRSVYKGDYYISAIHPQLLPGLMGDGGFPKAFTDRLMSATNTYSAFILYLTFKEKSFPYINHTCYMQDDYGIVWEHGKYDAGNWPRGMMYITPPREGQDEWAERMTINCIMPWQEVKAWTDTHVGHRGAAYKAWKLQQKERVLDKMEQLYPGFRDKIQDCYTASPLTIRDYYGSPEGTLYGFQKDCKDPARTMLMPVTKVRNLLLTGQCINLHGICGVPLTAINTAEVIFGMNNVVNAINAHQPSTDNL